MELYFCSVCGISIPQTEIEGGLAVAEGGKHLCSEHRPAPAASAPPAPEAGGASTASRGAAMDVELLFCANCRVSIPEGDAKTGRAHREFGSLLCSICSRADPGERAARRDAVEAELAHSEDDDLLRAPRMAVAAPSTATSSAPARRESSSIAGVVVALLIVGVVFAGVGWALGSTLFGGEEQDKEIAALRSQNDDLAGQIDNLTKRLDNADSSRNDIAVQLRDDGTTERKRIEDQLRGEVVDSLRTMRQEAAALKGELTGSDARLQSAIANIEGQIEQLTNAVKMLGNRPVVAPGRDPPGRDTTGQPPPPVEPVEPAKPTVNPKVAKHIRDLLESAEEAERFPAATELGRLGDESAIPALAHALANDSHYLVRRACARSLGSLRAWNAVPVLISALEEKESYVAQQANFALQNITGEDFGVSQDMSVSQRRTKAKAATKWWDKNGSAPPAGVSLNPVTLDPK